MANGNVDRGKALVGQGRMLAGHSRGDYWSDALDPNRSRLAAGKGAAKRLMEGTMMQNQGKANPYSDLGRYVRSGSLPPQGPRGNVSKREMAAQIQPKGGLAQMMAQQGASKKMVGEIEKVESMPGGMELLYTVAAEEMMKKQGVSKKDTKKVRLYRYGGAVERAYANGGSVKAAAERTRQAGRGEDSMMLHVSPEEYETIEAMWGKAEINPNTGIGEYGFLSKLWKKVKKVVKKVVKSKIFQVIAPIALSIFAPGLGTAIGGMLTGGGTGLVASTIGNAVLRGGLSAAGGQGFASGAISGAVSGGLGQLAGKYVGDIAPGLSDRTAEIIGSSLASGAGAELTGGDFVSGAIAGGLGEVMRPGMEKVTARGQEMLGLQDPAAGGILAERIPGEEAITGGLADVTGLGPEGLAPGEVGPPAPVEFVGPPDPLPVGGGDKGQIPDTGAAVQDPGMLERYAMPAILAASALGGGEYEPGEPPPLPPGFDEPLPLYEMNRQFQGMDPGAYYTYGQAGTPQSGQHLFMTPEPFAGVPSDPTTPTPEAGGMQGLIAAGQPVPANMVGLEGSAPLTQAGYTQDPATGNWMPPQLGQGLGQAMGGYQQGGDYWSQNADVPRAAPSVAASGRYVKGQGTGRSDDIPARLSDGEYVMDAESVALLGDGSGDAGARRLDEMRRNLRKHKATNLKKGGFSHKAKQPHQYMARGGMARLRRAMMESGRV